MIRSFRRDFVFQRNCDSQEVPNLPRSSSWFFMSAAAVKRSLTSTDNSGDSVFRLQLIFGCIGGGNVYSIFGDIYGNVVAVLLDFIEKDHLTFAYIT